MTSIRTALLALSTLAFAFGGTLAQGREHGGGRHDGGGRSSGGGYAAPGRGSYSPRGGGDARSFDPRARGRSPYEGARGYAVPGYAPTPYDHSPYAGRRAMSYSDAPGYSQPQSFRRGQYIPHAYWSGEIANPRGRHLRTPPPGYGWVGVGPNAYLMQRSTGLVLDSVPGAW